MAQRADAWPAGAPRIDACLAFAAKLADRARAIAMEHFRRPVGVQYKPDRTPVTEVDRSIESELRVMIAQAYPGHGIIGEELGAAPRAGGFNWIIDPIDGTKAFVTGKPLFGTLIGLLHDTVPILGVVEVPALGERWTGAAGQPTRINGEPCHTSAVPVLAEATLAATTIDMFAGASRARFEALSAPVRFRSFGGDCYSYGLLASGFIDLVAEAGLAPYDYLPLVPVVNGAGGKITDWAGAPLDLASSSGEVLAAASGGLHALALERLAGGR